MIICSACHQENPMEARFCGFCGFRMAPISSEDWNHLTNELPPIEVESPVILTEVNKVMGKGAQHLVGPVGAANPEAPTDKETPQGPRVVGKWEEPPVRVFPRGKGPGPRDTSMGRERGDSDVVASAPMPRPRSSTVPPGKAIHSGRSVTGKMEPPLPYLGPDELLPVEPAPAVPPPPPAQVVPPTPAPPVQAAPPIQAPRPSTPLPMAPAPARDQPDGRTARRYRRFPLKVEVGYATDHNFYTGFLENLSSGGLFIATHQPTQIGEVMEVTFTVPGIPAPCIAIAQVTWLRDYDASNDDMVPGMGLKFIQLDPKVRAAVELFIKHREPIFFD